MNINLLKLNIKVFSVGVLLFNLLSCNNIKDYYYMIYYTKKLNDNMSRKMIDLPLIKDSFYLTGSTNDEYFEFKINNNTSNYIYIYSYLFNELFYSNIHHQLNLSDSQYIISLIPIQHSNYEFPIILGNEYIPSIRAHKLYYVVTLIPPRYFLFIKIPKKQIFYCDGYGWLYSKEFYAENTNFQEWSKLYDKQNDSSSKNILYLKNQPLYLNTFLEVAYIETKTRIKDCSTLFYGSKSNFKLTRFNIGLNIYEFWN